MNPNDLILPPHSQEAEQSVIGGLLLDNNALDRIADILTPEDFYRHDHRLIFECARGMIEQGKPADIVTVTEALESSGKLQDVGGIAYLGALALNVPSAANIGRYAEIVQQKSILRGLLGVAGSIQQACLGEGIKDAEKIAQEAEESMSKVIDRHGGEPRTLHDVTREALAYIDERGEHGGGLAGLATGFHDLDRLTSGFEPGQLVIAAARPSVGKTILGCNIANHVATSGGVVLFFTPEMPAREIGLRILSARTRVSVQAMRTGTREELHWNSLGTQLATTDGQQLFIDDQSSIGVGYVRSKARRIQRKHGLNLVVIDYLQLMRGQGDNRTQEIGSISRGLKALAKELRIPVIALAQLNRGVEGRLDKRPLLSDLRDSGEVEQDADIVLMLHREELYNDAPEWLGYTELLVRKNRNGPTGELAVNFKPEEMRFTNYAGPNVRRQMVELGKHKHKPARGFED
jgi:replicative DNA helicase